MRWGWSCFAALDSSAATVPWTYLVRDHVPESIAFAAIAILTVWLPGHFAAAYRSRKAGAVEPIPVPPSKEADARNRMGRTWWQNLLADVLYAVAAALLFAVLDPGFEWTTTYWLFVAGLVLRSALTAVLAYFGRKVVPPHFEPAREVKPAAAAKIPAFEVPPEPPEEPNTDPLPGPYRWERS